MKVVFSYFIRHEKPSNVFIENGLALAVLRRCSLSSYVGMGEVSNRVS